MTGILHLYTKKNLMKQVNCSTMYSLKKFFGVTWRLKKGNIRDDLLCCTPGTYFNELTKGKRNGLFVDCGAYDGESSLMYMKFIGAESEVIAFEPDEDNYQNLMRKMRNQAGLTCLKKGCYSAEKNYHLHLMAI